MHVFVRQLDDTTRLFEVNEAQLCNVETVRAAVGVSEESQYLSIGGLPLEEIEQLSENCTLDILIKVPGGKVHGSLARAGKVRNQTPKVEKSEDKPKKLSGRARRRQQYTKRFINVVVGPGKKRGPNSNQK